MGNLITRLSQTELQTIGGYIDSYAGVGNRKVDVPFILRAWDEAKSENLANIFTNSLIIEKRVEYTKPISLLTDEFYEAFGDSSNALAKFKRIFSVFLWDNRESLGEEYYKLNNLLTESRLAASKYDGALFSVKNKDGYEIKVQTGCKPVKILGKVIHSYGQYLNEFEEFRLECSRILNQKKLTGTFCLSIHPLDYMTMSDNNCSWSSCMSWKEEGCYRQGTVEMMNSPMVVVGYLKSDNNDMNLRSMRWNSKKWRELFIVTPEIICGVKGYPYQNEQLVQIGIEMLKDLAKANCGWEYFATKEIRSDSYYVLDYDTVSYKYSFSTGYMYNDFGTTTHYGAAGVQAKPSDVTINDICYSGMSECMCCGDTEIYVSSEGSLICEVCDTRRCCDCCEDIYQEDELQELDGRWLCDYCYGQHALTDPISGEDHYDDDFITLYLTPCETDNTRHVLDYGYTVSIWEGALEDSYWSNYFDEAYTVPYGWGARRYVILDDCTKAGLELFGIYDEADKVEFIKHWNSYTTE